jgi:hypothetical protein
MSRSEAPRLLLHRVERLGPVLGEQIVGPQQGAHDRLQRVRFAVDPALRREQQRMVHLQTVVVGQALRLVANVERRPRRIEGTAHRHEPIEIGLPAKQALDHRPSRPRRPLGLVHVDERHFGHVEVEHLGHLGEQQRRWRSLGEGQLLAFELLRVRELDPGRQHKALGLGDVGERRDRPDRDTLVDEEHLPEFAAGGQIGAAAGHQRDDVGTRLGPVDRDVEAFVLEVTVMIGDRHFAPRAGGLAQP